MFAFKRHIQYGKRNIYFILSTSHFLSSWSGVTTATSKVCFRSVHLTGHYSTVYQLVKSYFFPSDTEKTAKKQRTSNATADSTPPTSKQPWINQVARQTHQPRQSCQPPVPFNIRPRNPPAQFYSERFPLGQNVPMQFNPRSHLSRLGPQPMPKLPSGVFYNHQQPHQYHTQAPVPPPYQQQPLPPPQFTSFQPCTPLAQHGTYPMIPNQSNPVNGQPQHVPRESSLPSQNVGQPLDQVWSPRVNSHLNGQPVNLGQFMARPGWPTVHPPTQPPFYCPPRWI